MATRNTRSYSLDAAVDLSAKEFAFGKESAGGAAVCTVLGERPDFVIGNAPASGEATDCQEGGILKVKVGAVAVLIDAELTTDANGLAKTAVSTNVVRAKALEAGAAGQVIRAKWVDAYIKP
jgi:hypothetical protein